METEVLLPMILPFPLERIGRPDDAQDDFDRDDAGPTILPFVSEEQEPQRLPAA